MRNSLSRPPKIIEAQLSLPPSSPPPVRRDKRNYVRVKVDAPSPPGVIESHPSRRGILAGGQLTSQERADRCVPRTPTHAKERDALPIPTTRATTP